MSRTVPVHYLRPNHAVWSPPSCIFLDTETRWQHEGDQEVHYLRLWHGIFHDRRAPKSRKPEHLSEHGFNQADLALQVHKWCQRRRTVWLYAHNLAFDMMTTDLLARLGELGWTVTDFAVDAGCPFARLSRGDCVLTMSDSFGWLATSVQKIGVTLGMPKPALPDNDDSEDAWLARCEADTEILAAAMLTLMDWWDREKLGRWNITGAASGWNAMRHVPTPDRILIRPDDAECEADRLAVYGGRRQCWRAGELPRGRYAELDIEKAYTTACRDLPLPVQRMARFRSLPLDHRWLNCERHGVIAECIIETPEPRYPCRLDGRVWYPVGRFRTVLAGPEIRDARDNGCLKLVGPGWVHELGYALRPWAAWILDAARPDNASTPEIAKITLRGWARSAIGKWAQRGFERIRLGPSPEACWGYQEAWDHSTGTRASVTDFGGWRWQVTMTGQADNAYPGILAFVESYVRVALGKAIDAIGAEHLTSCDTDGMICDALSVLRSRRQLISAGVAHPGAPDPLAAVLLAASNRISPFTLRDKASYQRVTVLGPQHVITDSERRLSGIPSNAQLLPDGNYQAWLWPKLAWQVRNGRAGRYTRPSRTYRLAACYAPGWVLTDGSVRPPEVTLDVGGSNSMLTWAETRHAHAGDRLGPHQGKGMTRYAETPARQDPRARHGPPAQRHDKHAHGTTQAAPENVLEMRAS